MRESLRTSATPLHIAWDAQEILRDIAEVQYEYQHSAHEYLEFMKRHRATYSH